MRGIAGGDGGHDVQRQLVVRGRRLPGLEVVAGHPHDVRKGLVAVGQIAGESGQADVAVGLVGLQERVVFHGVEEHHHAVRGGDVQNLIEAREIVGIGSGQVVTGAAITGAAADGAGEGRNLVVGQPFGIGAVQVVGDDVYP